MESKFSLPMLVSGLINLRIIAIKDLEMVHSMNLKKIHVFVHLKPGTEKAVTSHVTGKPTITFEAFGLNKLSAFEMGSKLSLETRLNEINSEKTSCSDSSFISNSTSISKSFLVSGGERFTFHSKSGLNCSIIIELRGYIFNKMVEDQGWKLDKDCISEKWFEKNKDEFPKEGSCPNFLCYIHMFPSFTRTSAL